MILSEVGTRYATALFNLAEKENKLAKIHQQTQILAGFLKKGAPLHNFLTAPQIRDEEKEKVVKNIWSGKIEKFLLNFLLFLMKKRRVQFFEQMALDFEKLYKEKLGIMDATLISVKKVEEKLQEKLINKLQKETGKKIQLANKLDPALIGGSILILANQVVDFSIRNRLNSLKERLLAVKVH
ncbi:MAG: ATP synthase F1 subunit delta [Thermodesulfobacteriota bacterium]